MTIQVVNGFVCMDCADVALARKDINPAHPPGSPNADPRASNNGQGTPAITFGGSLSQLSGAGAVQQPGGTTPPQLNPDQTNRTQSLQSFDPRTDPKLDVSA